MYILDVHYTCIKDNFDRYTCIEEVMSRNPLCTEGPFQAVQFVHKDRFNRSIFV